MRCRGRPAWHESDWTTPSEWYVYCTACNLQSASFTRQVRGAEKLA
jgi:hypothetical protein